MDVDLERARSREPRWDEVRERRVLARVLAPPPRRTRRVEVAIAVSACAAVAAAIWLWPRPAVAPAPAAVHDDARITLHDGSEVFLMPRAQVQVRRDERASVVIEQSRGEARYVVSHRPSREFLVR